MNSYNTETGKYIVELINLYDEVAKYLEEYLNWAESKGFKLMFINSISAQALCFFKKREVVDIRDFRPSQVEFNKWRKENGNNL